MEMSSSWVASSSSGSGGVERGEGYKQAAALALWWDDHLMKIKFPITGLCVDLVFDSHSFQYGLSRLSVVYTEGWQVGLVKPHFVN